MEPKETSGCLLFGSAHKDLASFAQDIEAAFQVKLEGRDGHFQGGIYFLGVLASGERLGVFYNHNEFDESYRAPHHKESASLLYIYGVDPQHLAPYAARIAQVRGLTLLKAKKPVETLVNVIDVESTCWETEPPSGQVSDIIEIGITVVDFSKLAVLETHSILVRPAHSSIGEFCTRLTTLTPELIEAEGVPFETALKRLRSEFRSKDRLFVSYGDYDRRMFERQCAAYGVSSPFGPRHLNVKNLFSVALGSEEVGMDEALAQLGEPLQGTHHRGGDDSRNIARVLVRLLSAARKGLS